jgi:hypothetical protein
MPQDGPAEHPRRGVDRQAKASDDRFMKPEDKPQKQTEPVTAEAQMQAWTDLRDQMQRLHAELEYVRLMLKLGVPAR